ncbi:SUR7/PalI family-domain-containing protein [Russula earlei]|uniref:SUR7/PalI family-domain-containing protein n=1 Tax=Russula earlei TaxID=71964 RepID=A0ACC0UIG3_9AGAM|nr:SUR7/PalI family-domain-containing protein [Russula earlei]
MALCWRRGKPFGNHAYRSRHPWRNKRYTALTAFCLFSASVLLIFIALSLPIIKPVYLLQLDGHPSSLLPETSIGTEIRFGVWGFCVTSALNRPTLFGNNGECVGPQLGYTIDPTFIAVVTNEPQLASLILKALTVLLILHPIASGLAFLTALPVLVSCCVYHFAPWLVSLVLSVPTAIMSTIVFAADLALVIVARHKLNEQRTVNITISFGNGVWIVLVSMLFTWLAMVLLAARVCRCCGFGRKYEIDTIGGDEGRKGGEKW